MATLLPITEKLHGSHIVACCYNTVCSFRVLLIAHDLCRCQPSGYALANVVLLRVHDAQIKVQKHGFFDKYFYFSTFHDEKSQN